MVNIPAVKVSIRDITRAVREIRDIRADPGVKMDKNTSNALTKIVSE